MARYRLSKSVPRLDPTNTSPTWVMTVTCSVPAGSTDDPNVFVYQTSATAAGDTFFSVATSRDMSVLPVEGNEADENLTTLAGPSFNNVPFYRVATAKFDCNNACEMNRIWETIKTEVQNLSWEMDAIDSPTWTETEAEIL